MVQHSMQGQGARGNARNTAEGYLLNRPLPPSRGPKELRYDDRPVSPWCREHNYFSHASTVTPMDSVENHVETGTKLRTGVAFPRWCPISNHPVGT